MISINNTWKSKLSIRLLTVSRNGGEINPIINTLIERPMARIIRPIVCGSLSNLKLIIEKNDASNKRIVVSSRKFIIVFL